jgi:hypothetical protein
MSILKDPFMDSVELPFLNRETTVEEALERLKAKQRSGVVIEVPHTPVLIHTGDLLYARENHVKTLGNIGVGERIIVLRDPQITHFKLDSAHPERTGRRFEAFLKNVGHRYALVGNFGDSVKIVTMSELDALTLMDTGGYQCDGSPTHYFPLPRVVAGQDCPMWPACYRPDRKPKIQPVP